MSQFVWGISGLHLLSWWNSSVYFSPSVSWFRWWIIWLLCSFLRTGIEARVMWNWAFHMSLVGVVCGKKVLFFLYGKLRIVALKLWCNGLLLSHHCIVITKGEIAFFLFFCQKCEHLFCSSYINLWLNHGRFALSLKVCLCHQRLSGKFCISFFHLALTWLNRILLWENNTPF